MYFLLKVFGGFPQQKVRPDGNKNPVDARQKKMHEDYAGYESMREWWGPLGMVPLTINPINVRPSFKGLVEG